MSTLFDFGIMLFVIRSEDFFCLAKDICIVGILSLRFEEVFVGLVSYELPLVPFTRRLSQGMLRKNVIIVNRLLILKYVLDE